MLLAAGRCPGRNVRARRCDLLQPNVTQLPLPGSLGEVGSTELLLGLR